MKRKYTTEVGKVQRLNIEELRKEEKVCNGRREGIEIKIIYEGIKKKLKIDDIKLYLI